MATTKTITNRSSSSKALLKEDSIERGNQAARITRHPDVSSASIHSGYFLKQSGLFKNWKWRYFVLTPQCLSYFRNDKDIDVDEREPIKRLFLNDIIDIVHNTESTKRSFVISISTKKSNWLLQASNTDDLNKLINLIKQTKEHDTNAEKTDPRRLSMRKLSVDTKRVILQKECGDIGFSIKKAGNYLLVSKIFEASYAARTGVLCPNDQLIEIEGVSVSNKSLQEVINIIHSAPDTMFATIRPYVKVPTLALNYPYSINNNKNNGVNAPSLPSLNPVELPPPYLSDNHPYSLYSNSEQYSDIMTLPAGQLKTVLAIENPILYDNL